MSKDIRIVPIPNQETLGFIAENGQVYTADMQPMRVHFNKRKGVYQLSLVNREKGVYVSVLPHVLVAKAFVEKPKELDGLPCKVVHLDGDVANNHYSNLQWERKSRNSLKCDLTEEEAAWLKENYVKGSKTKNLRVLGQKLGICKMTAWRYIHENHKADFAPSEDLEQTNNK